MMYPTKKERTHFARLCRAIIDLCTEILRNILQDEIDPKDIKTEVQKHLVLAPARKRLQLVSDQQDRIDNAHTDGYTNFDITLLYRLIRYLCTKLHPPTKGWFVEQKGNSPSTADIAVGDDIERIRDMRNKLYGHISDTCMLDQDFNDYWTKLEDIMQRMSVKFGRPYDKELAAIKSSPMDEELETKYMDGIKQTMELDKKIKDMLKDVKGEISSLKNCMVQKESDSRLSPEAKNNAENTEKMLKFHEDDKTYYITRAVISGLEVLQKHGLVLYSGVGGGGKTKAAMETMIRSKENDSELMLFNIRDINKWDIIVNGNVKSLVLLDDFLGKSNLDNCAVDNFEKQLHIIHGCIMAGNVKVILTLRENIFEQVWLKLQLYPLFSSIVIVNLSDEKFALTLDEKREIFHLHSTSNNIVECEDEDLENIESRHALDSSTVINIHSTTIEQILNTSSDVGFPQVCFQFCTERKYTRFGITFFERPSEIMVDEISLMRSSDSIESRVKYSILVYTLLNNYLELPDMKYDLFETILNIVGLSYRKSLWNYTLSFFGSSSKLQDIKLTDIINAIKDMNEKYLWGLWWFPDKFEIYLEFKHETVLENVALSLSKTRIDILLRFCSRKFICAFLRSENHIISEGEFIIKLNADKYDILVRRLLTDNELFDNICEFPLMSDEEFVLHFISSIDIFSADVWIDKSCGKTHGIFTEACKYGRLLLDVKLLAKYGLRCNIAEGLKKSLEFYKQNVVANLLNFLDEISEKKLIDCLELALIKGTTTDIAEIFITKASKSHALQEAFIKLIPKCTDPYVRMPLILNFILKCDTYNLDEVICSTFRQAILLDNLQMIEWLLDKNNFSLERTPVLTSFNDENLSSLHICAFFGSQIFLQLVELSQNVAVKSKSGLSVLQAALFGYVQYSYPNNHMFTRNIVLSSENIDIKQKSSILSELRIIELHERERCESHSYLHFNRKLKQNKILEYLLNHPDVDIDDIGVSLDKRRNTLGHYCVIHDDVSIIQIIANTKKQHILWLENCRNITPLDISVFLGRNDIFQILYPLYKINNIVIDMKLLKDLLRDGWESNLKSRIWGEDSSMKYFDLKKSYWFHNTYILPSMKFGNSDDYLSIRNTIKTRGDAPNTFW